MAQSFGLFLGNKIAKLKVAIMMLYKFVKQYSSPSFAAEILLEFSLIIEMFKFADVYTVDKKRVQ